MRGGEIVLRDTTIDLVYRDFGINEILSIEKHGGHVDAMKQAFRQNQAVSSLTGEFDHKSLFELFSNPQFDRYFTPFQRQPLRAVTPWTRLMAERTTTDAEGQEVDLPAYARQHREQLVLKPNRAYGGQDVIIGMDQPQGPWDDAVARALAQPNTWVVQALTPLPTVEFPDAQEPAHGIDEFVTVGFIATAHGIAFVGRSSPERIVNISRGGSLVPTFLVR